jgi:hypothetical protein
VKQIFEKCYSNRLSCNEYVLRIPMPWKADYYSMYSDRIERGRKWFAVIVSCNRHSGFQLRAWWSYDFAQDSTSVIA